MKDRQAEMVKSFLPEGLPRKLFKFAKIDGFLHDSLKQSYFWHSRRKNLNDPYDCYSSLLKYEPTHQQLVDYAKRTLLPGESLEEVTNYIINNPKKITEAYLNTADDVIDQTGLCSFTVNYESTLMWSHYAKHHKGVCLGFNTSNDLESFFVAKVRYTNDFIPLNYFDDPTTNAMIMYTTKAKDWEYEKEYRLVNSRSGSIPYNKKALVDVIFGCKCSEHDMLAVIHTIESTGHKGVRYLKAEMQPGSFRLSFRSSPWLNNPDK